jgi:hypothetical protein
MSLDHEKITTKESTKRLGFEKIATWAYRIIVVVLLVAILDQESKHYYGIARHVADLDGRIEEMAYIAEDIESARGLYGILGVRIEDVSDKIDSLSEGMREVKSELQLFSIRLNSRGKEPR